VKRRIIEQFRNIISHKPHTTGAGGNNIVCTAKIFDELAAYLFGIVPKTGIKSRLPATGLVDIVLNGTACFLQHFYHIERRLRVQLVYKTGYE